MALALHSFDLGDHFVEYGAYINCPPELPYCHRLRIVYSTKYYVN